MADCGVRPWSTGGWLGQTNVPPSSHGWSPLAPQLRLTPEDDKALSLLAEAEGISKQEATVRAIREAAARRVREDEVRKLSSAARRRYADLLDRLGQ